MSAAVRNSLPRRTERLLAGHSIIWAIVNRLFKPGISIQLPSFSTRPTKAWSGTVLFTATQAAVRNLVRLVQRLGALAAPDAYTLCSIAADVHVTRLVNVHKGVHVMLAKSALGLR